MDNKRDKTEGIMNARPPRMLVPLLALLSSLGPLAFDMYLPSLPVLQSALHTSAAGVQLTLSAYLIGLAAGTLIYGPLSDRFGRRPVLLIGLALYTAAGLFCALVSDLPAMILLRLASAGGGAAGMVLGRVIIRDYFPPRETARLISLMAMIMLTGPLVSPMIGGQLLVLLGWRSIFVLLAGLGGVTLILAAAVLAESHPPGRRNPLNLRTTLAAYGTILADRTGLGYALCLAMSAGVMYTYITSSSFVFIEVYGIAPDHFGFVYGIIVAGLLAGNYANSHIVMHTRVHRLISGALVLRLLAVSGLFLLVYTAGSGGSLAGAVALLVFAVGASALITPNITADMLHRFPTVSGTASAVLGASNFTAGAVAGVIAGLLHDGTALPMAQMMLVFACCSAAAYRFIARPAQAQTFT